MMKKITLLFSFAFLLANISFAQFTATYTFDSVKAPQASPVVIAGSGKTDPTPPPAANGVVFGAFTASDSLSAQPTATARFSFTKWPLGAMTGVNPYSSLTGAIDPKKYFEVTITPLGGAPLTLSSFFFKMQRSGTGIRTYAVRSSADAYATNLPASINPATFKLSVQTGDVFFVTSDSTNSTSAITGSTVTLSGASFTNFTSPVTFRFYGFNAEATGGTFSIDNVTFSGTSSLGTFVKTISPEASVSIYPNPSVNGVFNVDMGNTSNKTVVTVYNIVGKIIFTKEVNNVAKQLIDLSNEANGSYFINIKNDNQNITKKLIVNK
jgi:hypothetical protein